MTGHQRKSNKHTCEIDAGPRSKDPAPAVGTMMTGKLFVNT